MQKQVEHAEIDPEFRGSRREEILPPREPGAPHFLQVILAQLDVLEELPVAGCSGPAPARDDLFQLPEEVLERRVVHPQRLSIDERRAPVEVLLDLQVTQGGHGYAQEAEVPLLGREDLAV